MVYHGYQVESIANIGSRRIAQLPSEANSNEARSSKTKRYARSGCLTRCLDLACVPWCCWIEQRYQCFRPVAYFQRPRVDVAPAQSLICNDTSYKFGYYLTHSIYPQYATLVNHLQRDNRMTKKLFFSNTQESARKDIERAFGVLKNRSYC